MTQERLMYAAVTYTASGPDLRIRAFRQEVLAHMQAHKPLIDVRSPREYSGELLHMPDYPQEGALRGGPIPGAANVPWGQAVAPDGTFKSPDELRALLRG
jgi:thiosulfate/3-mercaptopyruvate sulfurtransferase